MCALFFTGGSLLIRFLIRRFIRDYQNVRDNEVREAYGILSGLIGILCNLMLFILKITAGIIINSIAVISDAFNNLADMGSSLITIFGARLSNRPPDREHPHGHGRYEYISSLLISFIIFGVGLRLLAQSFGKITNPEPISLSLDVTLFLVFSVLVKLWMYAYNKYIGEIIGSSVNKASAYDSLNDAIATVAVILGTFVGVYVNPSVDGIMGLAISGLIVYTGFKLARDSVHLLLGSSPDPALIQSIEAIARNGKNIRGTHDLVIHDYGPGRIVASMHAEVLDEVSIVDAHAEIDVIEQRVKDELGVELVIHIDPVPVTSGDRNP
jgi:cation diffusion facilitator family transporter